MYKRQTSLDVSKSICFATDTLSEPESSIEDTGATLIVPSIMLTASISDKLVIVSGSAII